MKIVQKSSHEKQSETTPASGPVKESEHRDNSESASGAHDQTPVSAVPTFRNRVGGLRHLTLVVLFVISGLYAAKRDLSSFAWVTLFLMLIGYYDRMKLLLQRDARVTAEAVLQTEADQRLLLLEIDPDISTADFRLRGILEENMSDRVTMEVAQMRIHGQSYLVLKKPRNSYQQSFFSRSSSLRESTRPAGFRHVVSPIRKPHRMNVDERIDQDSDEIGSALSEDENNTSNGAFGSKDLPTSTIDDHSSLLGRIVPKAYIPDHTATMAETREDTVTEINPTTADKPSRKKERRAKRQRNRRKMESLRKQELGAANLKKGEELAESMFISGWVLGDMMKMMVTLEVLLRDRERIYEELVREDSTAHGWRLYNLMSSWEREPGAMNRYGKKEEERIQRLIKGSWLEK